jgi:lysophospholipase L1-like esterase
MSFKEIVNSQPTIYLIGDSTMADKPEPIEINPERGWGQLLSEYFTEDIIIDNHAVNGRSSLSFISEGRWKIVSDQLKEGDFVVIQFGHNDQKIKSPDRYTVPSSSYYNNLSKFVKETRAKGAIPIIASSIVRRSFNEEGTLEDTHGLYPLAARIVALDLNVPFADMQFETETMVRELGVEESKKIYLHLPPGAYERFPEGKTDNTHLSPYGAKLYASLFIKQIKPYNLSLNKFLKS